MSTSTDGVRSVFLACSLTDCLLSNFLVFLMADMLLFAIKTVLSWPVDVISPVIIVCGSIIRERQKHNPQLACASADLEPSNSYGLHKTCLSHNTATGVWLPNSFIHTYWRKVNKRHMHNTIHASNILKCCHHRGQWSHGNPVQKHDLWQPNSIVPESIRWRRLESPTHCHKSTAFHMRDIACCQKCRQSEDAV